MKPASHAAGLLAPHASDDREAEEHVRPLEWGLILRLFSYTKSERRKVVALLGLTLLRGTQLPALTWAMSYIISEIIAGGQASVLPWAVLLYTSLALSTDSLFHFRQRYALELGERVVNALRSALFATVQRQPMGFFHRTRLGRILGRATSDVEAVRTGIQDVLFVSAIQATQMLVAAVLMFWADWPLFIIVIGMAPLLWVINRHFRGRLSREARAANESFSRISAALAESVNGMRVTQSFVREETNAGFFRNLLADHSRLSVAQARTSAILVPLLELNSQFFIAVLLILGGIRVLDGAMGVADLIQFFFLANLFFAPIATLGQQYNHALLAMAGAERVFRLIDLAPEWVDDPAAIDLPDPRREQDAMTANGMQIEFRNLKFGYVPGQSILHGIDLLAKPGQTIALVGPTGSGKSSIINLATKFYLPWSGELLVDSHDIRQITSSSLHRQTGLVFQQNFLFSGTVLDNIRYAAPGATIDQIRDAARRLDMVDLIEALPKGFVSPVGERGAGLSVGERQVVCFIRAFIANPRLLILDEATSAIDALTESRLQKALLTLLAGRTSFVIAHRLSTIRDADQILMMDQGRIIERGTYRELVAAGGAFARLNAEFAAIGAT